MVAMTDIAAIKAELRRLADEAKTLVEPSAEYTEWQRQAAHAFVNFAVPLLADTPSVEPWDEADNRDMRRARREQADRRQDIARIAAMLHETGVIGDECIHRPPWYACRHNAAALYDAGLRPSVEPAGINVERLAKALEVWRERVYVDPDNPGAWYRDSAKAIATEYALLLPTQASGCNCPKTVMEHEPGCPVVPFRELTIEERAAEIDAVAGADGGPYAVGFGRILAEMEAAGDIAFVPQASDSPEKTT